MTNVEAPPPAPSGGIQIAVVGPAVCDERTGALARELGAELARAGATVLTGGRGGAMAAASEGARAAGGLTVGILPGA
ncbi:MAG TPA: hypothetical protein PKX99_01595, partial [Thermoanaerobaculia bacterium]|nr:hypothetical protein [Thermoanaerobaculia bacterium]